MSRSVCSRPPMGRPLALVALLALALVACGGPDKQVVPPPPPEPVKPPPPPVPKTEAEQLRTRCDERLAAAKAARDELVVLKAKAGDDQLQASLAAYNRMQTALTNAEAESSLWRSVHPVTEMRDTASKCEQEVAALATLLSLDRQLYEAFAGLNIEGAGPDVVRLVTKTLEDFRRAGVDKDEGTRAEIKRLNDEIVKTGQAFSKAIIKDRRTIMVDPAALAGLPQDWIDAHKPGSNGKVEVSTDYPDYIPFLTYSDSDAARKELYTVYRQRGTPDNEANLRGLLELRHKLATTLGHKSWAHFETGNKMIGSAENANDFIAKIRKISGKRMKQELKELLVELRRTEPKARQVQDWQKSWVLGKLKKKKFGFDAQKMRPYLHYDKVKRGLLELTSTLFSIRYVKNDKVAVWHPDVEVYDVFEGEVELGRIYLDMHPRDDKYKHAAQFTLHNGLLGVQKAAGVLVCNFPNPRSSNGLMEHQQVQTFFHEFGHLMHHVLGGQQKFMRFSGVATEWDFVEAPSQIFEEWATDYETLKLFATDAEGRPVPKDLVGQMRAAKEFGKALWVRHQMFYASVSLNLYSRDPAGLDIDKLIAEMQALNSPYPFVADTHMQNSFGHLFGYSAIYYTYMWSLVIAKDLFSAFEKAGIQDKATAMRYRKAILDPGGSKDAAELVKDFLGRPHDFKSFESWLNRR